MRVWRFKQITDDPKETIDGKDQSFNALEEEKSESGESQTESETTEEQVNPEKSESEQIESSSGEGQSEKESDDSKEMTEEDQESKNIENEKQTSPQATSSDSKEKYKYFDERYKKLIDTCEDLEKELQQKEEPDNKQQSDTEDKLSENSSEKGLDSTEQSTPQEGMNSESEEENAPQQSDTSGMDSRGDQSPMQKSTSLSGKQEITSQDAKSTQETQKESQAQEGEISSEPKEDGFQNQEIKSDFDSNPSSSSRLSDINSSNQSEPQDTSKSSLDEKPKNNDKSSEQSLKLEKDESEEDFSDNKVSQLQNIEPKQKKSNKNQESNNESKSDDITQSDLEEEKEKSDESGDSADESSDLKPSNEEQTQETKTSEEITEQERKDIRDIFNNCSKLSLEEKRKLLNKVKKRAKASKKYRAKLTPGNKRYIKSLEEERIKENNSNNISDALGELPSFKERQRGDGYSIDPTKLEKVPNSVIKTLIDKFLNQRFCKKDTNLNIRSNSLEETDGFHKWKVKDVIVHLKSHQVTKVLTDKVGYTYADGKNENVPLSFYFDMSGSMSAYTSLLATIAIELLKKDVKVLIGYNERVNVQIDKIDKDISLEDLVSFLTQAGSSTSPRKRDKITYISINRNIDNYLVEKKAERCVVFSDFDPISEVVNLSAKADVYWFCFEDDFDRYDLKYYKGFIYKVKNINDIAQGLIKVNSKRFESLCFTDNPASLRGKVRKRQ